MTAKDSLDLYRSTAQYRITLTSLAIYFLIVVLFVFFPELVPAEHRLTIWVLLLTPLAGIINSAAAFWLNRSREDGVEKPPTITTTSTPDGGSKAVVTPTPDPPDSRLAGQSSSAIPSTSGG
jgi:CBS domain containing-hemolysin-like protein